MDEENPSLSDVAQVAAVLAERGLLMRGLVDDRFPPLSGGPCGPQTRLPAQRSRRHRPVASCSSPRRPLPYYPSCEGHPHKRHAVSAFSLDRVSPSGFGG